MAGGQQCALAESVFSNPLGAGIFSLGSFTAWRAHPHPHCRSQGSSRAEHPWLAVPIGPSQGWHLGVTLTLPAAVLPFPSCSLPFPTALAVQILAFAFPPPHKPMFIPCHPHAQTERRRPQACQ